MQSLVDKMLQLVRPPANPMGCGSDSKWSKLENSIGVSMPRDYKWLVDTYGAGDFGDMLILLNPFIDSEQINLESQLVAARTKYLEFKEIFIEECPYSVFPQINGLFPVAQDTNGNDLFWIANGPSDNWGLVHYNWRGGCLTQKHDMTLLKFMVEWIGGHLPDSFFGRGNSTTIIRRHPFFVPLHD